MSGRRAPRRSADEARERVRARYGEIADGGGCCDEGSSSCAGAGGTCCGGPAGARDAPGYAREEIASVPKGAYLGLGCGNPTGLLALGAGQVVLDLGSGAGVDCFLAAKKVGRTGRVIGVDMTPEMVSKSRTLAAQGGYRNVEFRLGEIEHLPVADASVDVVLSNCVINLAPGKSAVYAEAFRVLRPGGQLAVSDVVATRRIAARYRNDPEKWASCSSGALAPRSIRSMLRHVGFREVRIALRLPERPAGSPAAQASIGVVPAEIRALRPAD